MRYRLRVRSRPRDDSEEVLDAIRHQLKRMKLRAPPRPRDEDGKLLDPIIPADITQLTDERLGQLQSEFAAMAQYTQMQLALRAVEHAIAKRNDRIMRARVRLEKSGTNDDKAAKTDVDSRAKKTTQMLLVAESAERLTQAVHDGYIIGRDLCSREQTRRQQLWNK